MGGGQRQLLATCCDFPDLLPTAWLIKLPLVISSLPLPGPLPDLFLAPPLRIIFFSRDASHGCTANRWFCARNVLRVCFFLFIAMSRYMYAARCCVACVLRSRLRDLLDGPVLSLSSFFFSSSSSFFSFPLPLVCIVCVCVCACARAYVRVRVCVRVSNVRVWLLMRVLYVSCARERTSSSK